MAHKGSEPNKLPRIAFQVSKEFKKRFDHYLIEKGRTTKELVTEVLDKVMSGKIKL